MVRTDSSCFSSHSSPYVKKHLLVSWLHSLHVTRTKGVVQHVVHLGNVLLLGARLVSSGVSGPRPSLLGGQSVSQSSTVPVSVLLLVAC